MGMGHGDRNGKGKRRYGVGAMEDAMAMVMAINGQRWTVDS